MSHQDQGRSASRESHLQALKRTVLWLVDEWDTESVAFRDDCTWNPQSLCAAVMLWALGDEKNLTDRFFSARMVTARLFPRQEPAGSYQAFLKMLNMWTVTLLAAAMICFRRRMQQGDVGFVGYEYWKTLMEGGRHFVIRVGSNVTLLKKLGYARNSDQTVSLWPDKAAVRNQPPLMLRFVVVNNGKHPVFLVTALPKSRLSDKQVCQINKARWGVEVYYRSLKQTSERKKLRSQAAANVPTELNWSLAGLWGACLLGKQHHHAAGGEPLRLSVAGVLKALRTPLREYKSHPDPGEDLTTLLDKALINNYHRTKKTAAVTPRKDKKNHPPENPY